MSNLLREALEKGEFVVTCEIIPGRGASEDAQEKIIAEAKEMYETGRIHALSITDNPGGNPALLADVLGYEMLRQGMTPLVHFTCKDRNRNQIMSQLYGLEREGVENLLLMTGDYEVSGWDGRSRPVFDLDSVQIQMLVSEMNKGLEVEGRKGPVYEKPTHFFNGGVVNPYKYREGEVVPQYIKLEKKIISGAQFIITQLGYDARKQEELKFYLEDRGYKVPVIGNVFLLTRGAAKLMRAGSIAGCHISDELLATLEEEAAGDDKGRAARVERAAQMVAIAKGQGMAGVHIGGFGLNADLLNKILDRAEELADCWRDLVPANNFGEDDGCYLYEPEIGADGKPTGFNTRKRAKLSEDITGREKVFSSYRLSRFAHSWMFTKGKGFNGALGSVMDSRDEKKGRYRHHGIEHVGKTLIYGCQDCGDCGLEACVYTCPMVECPKCQRNGPCGGSMDGYCEVFPHERYCIWYKAFHRVNRYDELWRITSFITPPNKWENLWSSPWSNYTHERDNISDRIPVSLWFDGGQGGRPKDE